MSTLGQVILEGNDASKPTASIAGRLYFATDTAQTYRDNGSSWDNVTSGGGGGGNLTLETNGNLNTSQSVLNLVAGNNIVVTNTANGNVVIDASGGGGGGGWTQIGQVIVGSGGAGNIAFSSIPATYTNLKIAFAGVAHTNNNNLLLQFNGNTGAYYDWGYNNGGGSTNVTAMVIGFIGGANFYNGAPGQVFIDIPSYTNTTFFKMASSSLSVAYSGPSGGSFMFNQYAGDWQSTSAITDILLQPAGSYFVEGTTATLYGY